MERSRRSALVLGNHEKCCYRFAPDRSIIVGVKKRADYPQDTQDGKALVRQEEVSAPQMEALTFEQRHGANAPDICRAGIVLFLLYISGSYFDAPLRRRGIQEVGHRHQEDALKLEASVEYPLPCPKSRLSSSPCLQAAKADPYT